LGTKTKTKTKQKQNKKTSGKYYAFSFKRIGEGNKTNTTKENEKTLKMP
jgi:hypothetical protein